MINFSPLRTRRLQVQLQELTIGAAIALCKMPPNQHEAGTTALIAATVTPNERPLPGEVTDPRLWTVQERALVVSHYLAHTVETGPDFHIGASGKLSNYLDLERDVPPEFVDLGVVAGDKWLLYPLLGTHAESIERLVLTGQLPAERHGWWMGAMAAQLVRDGEEQFDVLSCTEAQLDARIAERSAIFKQFPESDFMDMLFAFLVGCEKLQHVFRIDFADDGILVLPNKEVPGLPPARFPFSDAISTRAFEVFGSHHRAGDGADPILQSDMEYSDSNAAV